MDLDHAADVPALGADPESGVMMRDVLDALDALTPDQKAVILLVGVEDLSYAAAARILGVPLGTGRSRLSRGRERLRGLLSAVPGPRLRRVK